MVTLFTITSWTLSAGCAVIIKQLCLKSSVTKQRLQQHESECYFKAKAFADENGLMFVEVNAVLQ